ncbi:MAG: TetR/AcrR family transcriptional regulator [Myxococcales bacterium]|nr:TetR/AcrR family transcriptional regulator [Myxococcales bacterium]MDH3483737.1 TetR/AcrR family transcriptional regulator [Myxococcales bacterium]
MLTAEAAAEAQESLRDKKRELYREAVLDAAERVFGELGYEATKVQRVAAEAGVSLTTLYSVFESKWEIYRAVNRRRLSEVMTLAQGILLEDASSIEMLIAGTRMQLAFFMKRRDFLRMQLKEVTAWSTIELLRSPEQVEALGAGLQLFADILRRCIEDGYLIDDDAELMARIVIASQQVRLAMWMDRGAKEDPHCLIDGAIRHMLRSYCKPERLASVLESAGLGDAS